MICTCDNCHYTFEYPELPTRCPDCGKETRSHKVGSRIVSLACVREATEAEIDCYKRIQRELAEEESQAAAAAALADKLMALGDPFSFEDDPYDMPVHEHNFALMLPPSHSVIQKALYNVTQARVMSGKRHSKMSRKQKLPGKQKR